MPVGARGHGATFCEAPPMTQPRSQNSQDRFARPRPVGDLLIGSAQRLKPNKVCVTYGSQG